MAGNIGVELNLAVGKINCVSPNHIPPTFNMCTCIKNCIEAVTELLHHASILNQPICNNTSYSALLPT